MKLKYYIQTGVVALAAATVGVSCTDTWDDHYSVNGTVPGATLWENMQLDESIRPFVRVLDSCGYKDILNANQVFTVWAPEITDAEAQEWIDTYKREKSQGIIDDDNSTLELHLFSNKVLFKYDNIVFLSRLLSGTYPTTSNIIPQVNIIREIININPENINVGNLSTRLVLK